MEKPLADAPKTAVEEDKFEVLADRAAILFAHGHADYQNPAEDARIFTWLKDYKLAKG
jgi:hypothetical protein